MTEGMPPAPMEPAPMAPPPMAPPMAGAMARPMGATVIAVIEGIIAVLAFLAGLLLMVGAGIIGSLIGSAGDFENAGGLGAFFAGLGFVFAIIVILIGVLYLAIAYGVWKGRGWSWMLGMVVSIIAIVFGVLGLSGGVGTSTIISLALPIVVVYFLWQPDVKRWLGRPA